MTITSRHGLDDYFEDQIDALTVRLNGLMERVDRLLTQQGEFLAYLEHRLDLVESCHPLENLENHRGF